MIEQLLAKLQDERVVETRRRESDGAPVYSLSHDILVAKVAGWFDEREMHRKRAEETLERGAAEYRSTRTLLTETQLGLIANWLGPELLSHEEELLSKSKKAIEQRQKDEHDAARRQEDSNRRTQALQKWMVRIVGASSIVFLALFGWALVSRNDAHKKTKVAQKALL